MRKLFYVISLLFLSNLLYSQDQPTTVYTCKGGTVSALNRSEYSQSDITYWTNYTSQQYSYLGITIIGDASRQYNCHSYAWHLTEGNSNKVWINNATQQIGSCYDQAHNIDKYWTDGCFIQVCNEADADKVHYYCGDHSAVASTTYPGYFESKWGGLALVRHTRTGVPYSDPVNSVNYYASIKITGDLSNLCSGTRTFSVKNISGATYTWTYSSTLSVVGPVNTNQITVQKNGSSTGAAWVEVQISTPCSSNSVTNRANFTVGSPDIQGYYVAQANVNGSVIKSGGLINNQLVSVSVPQSYTVLYSIELTQNLSSVTWNLYGIGNITSSTSTHLYWTMPAYGSSPNNCTVVLNAVGQCGPVSGVYPFQVVGLSGYGYTMLASPNPATNNINVQIMQVADTSSTANSIDASSSVATSNTLLTNSSATTKFYLCDLYSNAVVKQWQFQEAKSASYNLNITGVRSGTYVLKMERNNKTTTTKILVQ